jgi:hypothetical protein
MRSLRIHPLVSACLAIFLIVTVAVSPILDTWIQSADVNFIEEVKVSDSQETEAESSVTHLFCASCFEIDDLGSGVSCLIPYETSSSHSVKTHANPQRGPPISLV